MLGIIPIILLHRHKGRRRLKIAQFGFDCNFAEFIPFALFHHISHDEIALVGGEFGNGRHNAEIGIALRQIELAQFGLVIGQTVRIVTGARREWIGEIDLLRRHFAAQFGILELLIAEDVDAANFGFWSFTDFKHDIDTVLIKHDHFRLNARRKAALAAIEFDDPRNVSTGFGTRKNLTRGQFDFGTDLIFFQALIALQKDAVDHWVFPHLNDDFATVGPDLRIGK